MGQLPVPWAWQSSWACATSCAATTCTTATSCRPAPAAAAAQARRHVGAHRRRQLQRPRAPRVRDGRQPIRPQHPPDGDRPRPRGRPAGPEPARDQQPAAHPGRVPARRRVNALVSAWLQFMIKDWFSHGHGDAQRPSGPAGRRRPLGTEPDGGAAHSRGPDPPGRDQRSTHVRQRPHPLVGPVVDLRHDRRGGPRTAQPRRRRTAARGPRRRQSRCPTTTRPRTRRANPASGSAWACW